MDNSDNGNSSRAEAERWLYTANKLLTARDLHGARSFAIRARESDPTFDASELLLAVIDTLIAGEAQINGLHDWYSVLHILPYTHNLEYIASQYRRLALLLDPHRNPFAFASHAFSLVHDAWSVLSNPPKKALYDNELRLLTAPPPPVAPPPVPPPPATVNVNPPVQKTPAKRGPKPKPKPNQQIPEVVAPRGGEGSFWTACPYCYVMYEYPAVYEECTMRCQRCRRGYYAARVREPPVVEGGDLYYCCWGFFPVGFSGNFGEISGGDSKWNPFSAMFGCPMKGVGGGGGGGRGNNAAKGPWVYHDDDAAAAFIELSDPSDDDSDDADWGTRDQRAKKRGRYKVKNSGGGGGRVFSERTRRGSQQNVGEGQNGNLENGAVVGDGDGAGVGGSNVRGEVSKKGANSARRRGAGNLGKLDLNVEFSNEVEEAAVPQAVVRDGNVAGNAEENIEGNAFFEGLDEFLNSLPILNVVADDKVKGH